MAKIVALIFTEEKRGKGTEENPIRACPQLWTADGTLVAESDPFTSGCYAKVDVAGKESAVRPW